jgi:3-oxoacyl-[acyl-carrier-protein] synthase II
VLESRRHAEARGAKPFAKISRVVADRASRKQPGRTAASLEGLWAKIKPGTSATAIITGVTGAEPATAEERKFLDHHKDIPVRATATRFGHLVEAQFPLGLALAALSIKHGKLFPPGDKAGAEIEMPAAPSQIVVVGTGHWRGEGMALVEAV